MYLPVPTHVFTDSVCTEMHRDTHSAKQCCSSGQGSRADREALTSRPSSSLGKFLFSTLLGKDGSPLPLTICREHGFTCAAVQTESAGQVKITAILISASVVTAGCLLHAGERFLCRQSLCTKFQTKGHPGPECFPSCCFLIACSGSDIFLSSFHQCIPIPSVFHVIPLLLLSPWVMLNTLLPGLIGVASSHLFKVSLL